MRLGRGHSTSTGESLRSFHRRALEQVGETWSGRCVVCTYVCTIYVCSKCIQYIHMCCIFILTCTYMLCKVDLRVYLHTCIHTYVLCVCMYVGVGMGGLRDSGSSCRCSRTGLHSRFNWLCVCKSRVAVKEFMLRILSFHRSEAVVLSQNHTYVTFICTYLPYSRKVLQDLRLAIFMIR